MAEREAVNGPGPARVDDALFRLVVEGAEDCAIIVLDASRRVLSWNRGAERLFGYAAGEMVGRSGDALFTPEDIAAGEPGRELAEALGSGRAAAGRWQVRKDGTRFRAGGVLTRLDDGSGGLRGFCKILRDETVLQAAREELARVEGALGASEERFRRLIEANIIGVGISDAEGLWVDANDALLRLLGHTRDGLRAGLVRWDCMTPEEYLEADARGIAEADERGACTPYEKEYIRADGRRVPVLIGYAPVTGFAGHYVCFVLDLTPLRRAESRLRESEERFRAFMDNSPAAAWMTDAEGRIVYLSGAYRRTFRFSDDEVIGRSAFELYPEELARAYVENIRAAAAAGGPVEAIERGIRRDDSEGTFLVYKFPIPGPGGRVLVGGVAVDITTQKRVEERQALLAEAGRILGSSLDYPRTLSDVCRLMVPVLADWCTLDLVTDAGEVRRVEIAHADPAKVALGHEFRRRYPPDPGDERGLMRVLRTGEPEVYPEVPDELLRRGAKDEEHYRLLRDLGLRSVIIVPLTARGRTLGALSLVTAESGRRYGPDEVELATELAARAALAVDNARLFREAEEAAIRREEALARHKAIDEQLTHLVEASGSLSTSLEPASVLDAVVSLSRKLISADAYAVWRYDPARGRWGIASSADLSQRYRSDSIVVLGATPTLPSDPVVAEDVLASPLLAGRREMHEREGVRSLLAVPLRVGGQPDGTIVFYYRTPHRFTEVEVRVATALANLASSAIRTSELYEAIRENDRRKDEFLAMLAHELRNPLSAVGNAVQVIRRSSAPEHLEWAKEVIGKHVGSLARMIDDLLDVSRITRGKIELKRQLLEVMPLVAHAVETVRPMVEGRRHELTVTHTAAPMWIEADPHRVEQVLVNLLANAAKYTEAGGRIAISARPDGDAVAIAVADNGSGMAPERIPEMFELFAQGDRTVARSEGGLGIGLTLVKNLVEMHGGSVAARSDGPGTGSEFTVRLPAAAAPAPARSARPPAAAGPPRRRSRVLVVDDNRDSALGLARLLRVLGNDVEVAHDGPSALRAAHGQRPEYVLLDIGLPGMDGYQVAERLRAEGFAESVIIAVSGYGEEAARRRSREAGFDHHLVKPVDYEQLVALIRRGR